MAAENFKVKKGLEVGTAITATSSGVNVTGIVTATQFVGDGSGLTGVTGSGSGVVIKDEGSAVGTAGTINFVGSGVAASLSLGTATITINAGGLDNVVEDLTPQLGGNLDLNGKFVNGTGGANITGVVTATTLKGNGDFVDIDVDGRADLDDVVVAGITTFSVGPVADNGQFYRGIINSGSQQKIVGGYISGSDTLRLGESMYLSSTGLGIGSASPTQKLDVNGSINATGNAVVGSLLTASGLDINGNADVSGRTDLDDLVVSGVGTFSTRIDTNGVSLGTNNNTFAAKFVDDAVANFGTDNDLKISHDNSNALIRNSKGKMVVVGVVSATSGAVVTGVVTATTFSGSGASLTNLPSAQLTGALPALDGSALTGVTGSGSGIIVRHDGSVVGTASSINFSTNLDVSAISAGIVTVTASGGSSQNVFSTIAVSGQSNVVADSTTDTLTFAAGSNVTLTTNAGTDTVTIAAANDNTQLSSEQVQDIVGAMFSSNTETDITATYQDADGTIDLVVDLSSLNASNLASGTIPNGRFPATLPATSGANLTALNASEITSGTLPIARIADDAVTFAKMQNVGTGVFIGRDSSGAGDIETLTAAEARTLLNVADGANVGVTTAAWTVGHNGSSNYVISGPGGLSNANNPDLYLERGQTYQFIVNASGHGFGIQTSSGTWNSSNAYTTGITNAGAAVGTITFEVRYNTPSRLYYACTSQHGGMVGNIYIIGNLLENGVNNRVLTATSAYGMNGESNLTFDGTNLDIDSDSGQLRIGDDQDLLLYHNGSNGFLKNSTGQQLYRSGTHTFENAAGSTEYLRIDSSGRLLVGHTASVSSGKLQVFTKTADSLDILSFDDTAADGGRLTFYRNRNTTYGSNTKVADDDSLGRIDFRGMNTEGTDNYEIGASIRAEVDGTPGSGTDANDMPGRLMFFTTPDGSDSPVERLRITSSGEIGIGITNPTKTGIQNLVKVLQIDGGDGAELILGNSVSSNVSTNHIGAIAFKNIDTSTGNAPHYAGIRCNTTDTSGNMNLKFYTGTTNFESDTPQASIDSSGRVIIGNEYTNAGNANSNITLFLSGTRSGAYGGAHTNAIIFDNQTAAVDAGGSITLAGYSGTQAIAKALIRGGNEADAATQAGYFSVFTRPASGSLSEKLRIDSAGSVSIGRASSALAYGSTNTMLEVKASDASNSIFETATFRGGADHNGAGARVRIVQGTHRGLVLEGGRTSNAAFGAIKISDQNGGLTSSVHINSSGTWFWGKTSQSSGTAGVELYKDGPNFITRNDVNALGINCQSNSTGDSMRFYFQDAHRGSLNWNGSNFDAVNASDYRLKENDTPITDGIERVKQLRPIKFNWKKDPSTTYDGFFAHEVQTIVPAAVIGEKDAEISEKGEGYQMMSNAPLIPLLTAALKEEIAKREALEARIAALEGS